MSTISLDHWFPSVIGKSFHPEWIEPVLTSARQIWDNPDTNLNEQFYYNGRTTHGTRNLFYEPQFKDFGEFILQKGKEFLELQGYDSNAVNWRPYMFLNSFKEGSAHAKHLHSQCSISGIYYLQTPPGSSPITFYPHQTYREFFDFLYAVKDPANWYNMSSTKYDPYPGLLMIWPGWLWHEVVPNQSQEPRTSIVFNL